MPRAAGDHARVVGDGPRPVPDYARQFRAKQEIHTERDRLLKKANRRIDLRRYLPSDDLDTTRIALWTLGLSIMSMVPYVLMILAWFLLYHTSMAETVGLYLGLLAVGLLMAMASTRRALGRDRPWLRWSSAMFVVSATVGLIVGFFLYFRVLIYFLKYEEMRTYTNVAAAQSASEFDDASAFLFTQDTRVDAMRAVGFKSRWTGDVYCVAPVVDSTMNSANNIHFWVAGVNCCSPRAAFHCDGADDFQARGALVWLDPNEIVRPFMRWAVQGADFSHFAEAVKVQEATYFTQAAPELKFLRWSRDPMQLKNSYQESAKQYAISLSLGYFAVLLVGSPFIAFRLLPRKQPGAAVPPDESLEPPLQ